MKRIDLAHIRRMADVIATTDDHDAEPGFLDTLAGETPIEEIADWLIASILDDEAQIVSLEAQIETMQTRLARKKVRVRGKRKVGAEMLQAAGLKRLLEAGEDVPGAQLVWGGDTLTIRSA